jgi:uncharacterized protein YecA (UPF0149 family)
MENLVEPKNSFDDLPRARKPELKDTIEALRAFGECEWETRTQWLDYVSSFPLDARRTSDLLEIIEGETEGDFDGDGDYWLPVHAWRILAINKVERAVSALVDLMTVVDDEDDWAQAELPEIIAMFGVKALPSIRHELLESTLYGESVWGYVALLTALGKIAEDYPETRKEVGELLTQLLTDFELHTPTLNSFLISELVDLGDPAALPLIQKVFARKFLDESVLDWPFVRSKFLGVEDLPEKIKVENYNPNDFHYSGDERFQKILKALDSSFNIEDLKCYLLGSLLAIDMVKPSDLVDDILTDLLDEKTIEFESDGQAFHFYREFFGLWNQLAEFQSKLFELSQFDVNDLSDLGEQEVWSIKLMRLQFELLSFIDGLRKGNTDGNRLEDGDAADFMLFIEGSVDEIETVKDNIKTADISVASKLFDKIHLSWNKGYLQFATACREARRREINGRKFIAEHKDVGRNEPCPCGSGKKFKKCCLEKYH